VEARLERALCAWGERRPADARSRLEPLAAADERARTNLDWLLRRPPAALAPGADARAVAQAVLAARGALP
jgi:hypothetical protein